MVGNILTVIFFLYGKGTNFINLSKIISAVTCSDLASKESTKR